MDCLLLGCLLLLSIWLPSGRLLSTRLPPVGLPLPFSVHLPSVGLPLHFSVSLPSVGLPLPFSVSLPSVELPSARLPSD